MLPLLDAIIDYVPAPKGDFEGPAQVLVSTIDYNDYVGRIGVGREMCIRDRPSPLATP